MAASADSAAGAAAPSMPPTPAQLAKAALRRLAVSRLEPTPDNYAQAWADEAGESHVPGLAPRARSVFERLAQRATDDPAQREALLKALVEGRWDDALPALERSQEAAIAQTQAWAQLIERMARLLERGSKQWTTARKKDSLQRVLDSSRNDMQRLQHRLKQLVGAWESGADEAAATAPGDGAPEGAELSEPSTVTTATATADEAPTTDSPPRMQAADNADAVSVATPGADAGLWPRLLDTLEATVRSALPGDELRAQALAAELDTLMRRIARERPDADTAADIEAWCTRARRLLTHRHHLVDQLHRLSQALATSLVDLAEDGSWAQGQALALQQRLAGHEEPADAGSADATPRPPATPSVRMVRAASELLMQTRQRQQALRAERDQARGALKELIHSMLQELGQLDEHTGRFSDSMLRHAQTVERAETLESLAQMVRAMVDESRQVHTSVSQTRQRLRDERERAVQMEQRVLALEAELRRVSEEAGTDALTQVANRRGLMKSFELEQARLSRQGGRLAVALIDIDNFKRLNDSLGHAAGDRALVALADHVRAALRPIDVLARFGGEEFVVLLPQVPVDEAQQALTRLQRSLTASLFMHENREVFVTFSAGVTDYRPGETIESALERADEGLYEAKRSGKNRTCIA